MTPRSDIATRLRLASGLVLMTFACTHLINHALGIHSLGAMEAGGQDLHGGVEHRSGDAAAVRRLRAHVALALHKLWRRRSLRMPAWEIAQVVLGFLIPFWLVVHVLGTRGAQQLFGVDDSYAYVLNALWPDGAWRQSVHADPGVAARLHRHPFLAAASPLVSLRPALAARARRCSCRPWP